MEKFRNLMLIISKVEMDELSRNRKILKEEKQIEDTDYYRIEEEKRRVGWGGKKNFDSYGESLESGLDLFSKDYGKGHKGGHKRFTVPLALGFLRLTRS